MDHEPTAADLADYAEYLDTQEPWWMAVDADLEYQRRSGAFAAEPAPAPVPLPPASSEGAIPC